MFQNDGSKIDYFFSDFQEENNNKKYQQIKYVGELGFFKFLSLEFSLFK